jgi:uncharacterized membrane protein YeaQ/YmgE (transglycosylase-associated protein family)
MDIPLYLILLAFLGLVTGAFARLALPGPDPMSIMQTMALGLSGSFLAGLIGLALWGSGVPGLLLSIVCATVILYVIRRRHGGGLMRPAGPGG